MFLFAMFERRIRYSYRNTTALEGHLVLRENLAMIAERSANFARADKDTKVDVTAKHSTRSRTIQSPLEECY